jgi:hypothetical protein
MAGKQIHPHPRHERSILDRFKVNGRPVGELTGREAREALRASAHASLRERAKHAAKQGIRLGSVAGFSDNALQATGASDLDAEELLGLLLSALDQARADLSLHEEWRRRGAAFLKVRPPRVTMEWDDP